MGSICVHPKSPQRQPQQSITAGTARRNKIEPLSNAQFIQRRRSSTSKRVNKVADLTYKNTWSSFLKSSQSDQVKFVPIKSPSPIASGVAPLSRHLSVRFNHRRSWDDSLMSEVQRPCDYSRKSLSKSSSPVRRSRPSSMRTDSRKYLKQESKAMREAWLNENVFPQFGLKSAASVGALIATDEMTSSRAKTSPFNTLDEFVNSYPNKVLRNSSEKRRSDKDAKITATTDSFITPSSLEISGGTSTLATTRDSVNVNATSTTSSPFTSFESAHFPVRPNIRSLAEHHRYHDRRRYHDDSIETTSQSVEVQVSSMTTQSSNTSMQPNMSSGSSSTNGAGGFCNRPAAAFFVNDMSASAVARDVMKKERAISSANSRKSCLKESFANSIKHKKSNQKSNFKDRFRLEWTKRYLYT